MFAHILADSSVIEKIGSGLSPNEDEHGITLDFYEVKRIYFMKFIQSFQHNRKLWWISVFWNASGRCKAHATQLGCCATRRGSNLERYARDASADALARGRCPVEQDIRQYAQISVNSVSIFLRDAGRLDVWVFTLHSILIGYYRALQFQDMVKYGSIFGGIAGLIVTAVAFYMQNEAANETAAVSAVAEKKRETENQSVKSVGLTGNGMQ